jgi:hypothetical protein
VPWHTGSKHTGELVLLGKSFLHVLPENKSINHKIQVKYGKLVIDFKTHAKFRGDKFSYEFWNIGEYIVIVANPSI